MRLGAAEDEAAKLGAQVISNSWSISTDAPDSTYGKYFDHPGHAITFSGGDIGYGTRYPADSQYVTAVEGTTLTKDTSTSRGWSETVWGSAAGGEGTGSGCWQYNTKPAWQKAASVKDTACAKRTQGDVAADANPSTGAAVYDIYGYGGWLQVGGDSEASRPWPGCTPWPATAPPSPTPPTPTPTPAACSTSPAAPTAPAPRRPSYLCTARGRLRRPLRPRHPQRIQSLLISASRGR